MKKILLIENDENVHLQFRQELNAQFNQEIILFPSSLGDSELNYNYNGFLLGHILEDDDNFEKIANFYPNIDLFIIDVSLVGNTNARGLDFAKYILLHYKGSFKIIIASNNQYRDPILSVDRVSFISKFDTGRKNFIKELVSIVSQHLSINKNDIPTLPNLLSELKQTPSSSYTLHKIWQYFRDNLDRTIDKTIFLLFYILIFASTVFAGYKIIYDIVDTFGSHDTSALLTTAEHIFLSLLPIYIVLGFFKYYRSNLRINFFGAVNTTVDEEASTKTMSLTKILFVSSIISYSIIRILDMVFEKKELNVTSLVSYGIFLAMMMIYYILIDRKHH